ncbi:MAG: hypothetical protein ACYS1A_03700 [Planctomycetota bacterium]|jgi:hypothetical protein
MDGLNLASRQSIFFSVSYVIAGQWSSDAMKRLDFQRELAQKQLDFPQTRTGVNDFTFVRAEPSALLVKSGSLGPNVSSISISSERPAYSLELFAKEAEVVCDAYRQIFLQQQCQILKCSAVVRHLYSCRDHAFKYLWEDRLSQNPQDFHRLGQRPVMGGGLRLFMPPVKNDAEPVQIEIKVESYFREANKMFIETVFVWPKPRLLPPEEKFDPQLRLEDVEEYAETKVCDFVMPAQPED